jgi:hypothetical protein
MVISFSPHRGCKVNISGLTRANKQSGQKRKLWASNNVGLNGFLMQAKSSHGHIETKYKKHDQAGYHYIKTNLCKEKLD